MQQAHCPEISMWMWINMGYYVQNKKPFALMMVILLNVKRDVCMGIINVIKTVKQKEEKQLKAYESNPWAI